MTFDPLHEDLPATLGFPGYVSYPWGGLTAAYSAADLARQKVLDRDNARKVVVLMSDGEDNSSRVTVNQLIENFKQANIPLWTVAFGDSFSTHDLENLADETGGQFILAANESQLQEKFAAIQTGIVFQYIAELQSATLPSNAQLELTLGLATPILVVAEPWVRGPCWLCWLGWAYHFRPRAHITIRREVACHGGVRFTILLQFLAFVRPLVAESDA